MGITASVERYCVDNRVPFQIIYDTQLANLSQYRVLALAGCVALSDEEVAQVLQFVEQGGRLCVIGPAATYNEWMVPRKKDVFANVPKNRIVRIDANGDLSSALLQSAGGKYSFSVAGREGLYTEYTSTPGRELIHLVNFRPEIPLKDVKVSMTVPKGKKVKRVRTASPDQKQDQNDRFTREGSEIFFTVPQVDTYSIAVVDLD